MNMAEFAVLFFLGVIALASAYEVGTVNKYSYETTVLVTEKCEEDLKTVGHRLKANVHLSAVWKNSNNPKQILIKIQILNPKLFVPQKSSFEEHDSELNEITSSTSYLFWEDGLSKKIWEDPQESFSIRNLKRSIASLLQLRNKNERIKEEDVSGNCDVEYVVKGRVVRKRKGNCVHSQFDKTLSQAPGVRSGSIIHHSATDYELKDEKSRIISKCSVLEYIKTFSNTWHRPSLCVTSKSELVFDATEKDEIKYENKDLESIIEDLQKTHKNGLESSNIEAILVKKEEKKKNLKTLITNLQDGLKSSNLAKVKSATAFYKLLPVFRVSSKVDILQVLKEGKFEDIRPQLLDLVSASSTESSLEAGLEFFSDVKGYDKLLERFIISLAILPRPGAFLLKQLKSLVGKNSYDEIIKATLLTTTGTVLKVYSANHDSADVQLVEDIRKYLESNLRKCNDDTCRLNFLRSLRNAAQPRSSPLFLEYAEKGGKMALEAVLALREIPVKLFPSESQKKLLNVFHQVGKTQDRSTRAIAAELLLRQRPGSDILKHLLHRLSDQSDLEFSSFLASKVSYMMSQDEELRTSILKLMPEKDVSYYYSLSQNGKSNVFRKPMLSVEGTNATYGLESELLVGGLLKRTVFDVSFENHAGGSTLISVGIFAEGLGSFVGTEAEDDGGSPTAGMELGFLGSALRPYVFFTSTSELMGLAWSGAGSEKTPVFQCILAFCDDERMTVLSNGMVVRHQLRGALSADASASIQLSIWNRNAHSLVQTAGGVLVRGSVSVDAGFVATQAAIQFKGESGVDFTSDLEFYESPFSICLQMQHPDVTVQSDVFRSTLIAGSKYQLKRTKKRTIKIPGRSLAFHGQNNDMCRILNSNN